MKATIEVKNRDEATALRAGLADPTVRAFVVVCGVLDGLPTDLARARVFRYVTDKMEEACVGTRTA